MRGFYAHSRQWGTERRCRNSPGHQTGKRSGQPSGDLGKPEIKLTDFGLAIDLKNVLAWTESGGTIGLFGPRVVY